MCERDILTDNSVCTVCTGLDPGYRRSVEVSRAHQGLQTRRWSSAATAGGWKGQCACVCIRVMSLYKPHQTLFISIAHSTIDLVL